MENNTKHKQTNKPDEASMRISGEVIKSGLRKSDLGLVVALTLALRDSGKVVSSLWALISHRHMSGLD